MGQFDNPKSIAVLFVGAFLCSLAVIAFLNAEVQSRSNYGSRIRNESLLEILGKKVSQTVALLKEKNSHRRSLLYHLFTSENATRTSMRKLQYFSEERAKERNETRHRLRHEKKTRREMENRRKNSLAVSSVEKPKKTGWNSFVDRSRNRTVGADATNASEVIAKEKLAEHRHCYTTNDVLEIIAMTCLVNFIFWFLIIFCVNVFTKNRMWKSQSSESLTSISSLSEDELSGPGPKEVRVDCFVDSRNAHAKGGRLETEILVPGKFSETGNRKKKTFRIVNWRRDKLMRFSNGSATDSEENRKSKYLPQNKAQKTVNSFSMENLIF